MKKYISAIIIILILLAGTGCVYFNTFYHARQAFKQGESARKAVVGMNTKAGASYYRRAIDKSDSVLVKYPNSKWYDDALFINGVSLYWTDNYSKAEKRFRELLANFPQSQYAKESELYLAKSKLGLGKIEEANDLFEELFLGNEDRLIKANAAMSLGEYFFEEEDYETADGYFQALIDSLGNKDEVNKSNMYIADGLYNRFKYAAAIKKYQNILKSDLNSRDIYKVKFRIGECCLFTNEIQEGLAIFNELASNDLYYDSLPSIKLMMAQGYEWDGDMDMAESVYEEIAMESPRTKAGGISNYILGLIYQSDYEDYKKAKEYFDAAKAAGANSGIFDDALRRSTNIGKLESFRDMEYNLDSTSTQNEVDQAARTQYFFAELYLTEMNMPDSALREFEYVLVHFPDAFLAPKALITIGIIKRDYFDDTTAYREKLREVLAEYPHSDYAKEAIDLLGLSGTVADSGYAGLYYKKSEHFLFEDKNLDSARYYMSIVADSFPYSLINEKAKFALLWMIEEYESPGDSSLYYAYYNFADSFPNSEFGKEASNRLIIKPKKEYVADTEGDSLNTEGDSLYAARIDAEAADDSASFKTVEEICHIGPDGKTI